MCHLFLDVSRSQDSRPPPDFPPLPQQVMLASKLPPQSAIFSSPALARVAPLFRFRGRRSSAGGFTVALVGPCVSVDLTGSGLRRFPSDDYSQADFSSGF